MNCFAAQWLRRNRRGWMGTLLLTMLLLPWTMTAEVVMLLELPQQKYMLYEPIVITLTLRNNSGQVLVCGGEAELKGELELELQNVAGRPRPGTGIRIPLSGLILRPGADQSIKVEISRYCPFDQLGVYRLSVLFRHPMLSDVYTSNQVSLNVSEGYCFWERKFGIPKMKETQSADPVKMRTYSIHCLQDKGDNRFYFRISDEETIFYQCSLGEAAGSRGPTCQLDTLNRIYILMPLGDKFYHLQLFDWNGEKDKSEYYQADKTVPALYRDPATGNVTLLGGKSVAVQRMENDGRPLLDLPEDDPELRANSAPAPAAPSAAVVKDAAPAAEAPANTPEGK